MKIPLFWMILMTIYEVTWVIIIKMNKNANVEPTFEIGFIVGMWMVGLISYLYMFIEMNSFKFIP
jgi:hypothetical protein